MRDMSDKDIAEMFRTRMYHAKPKRITQADIGIITDNTAAWANAELLKKPRRTLRKLWIDKTVQYWSLGEKLGFNSREWFELLDLPIPIDTSEAMPIYKLSSPWPHNYNEQTSTRELGKALARLGENVDVMKSISLPDAAKIIIDSDIMHTHIKRHSVVFMYYLNTQDIQYGELAFLNNKKKGLLLGRYLGKNEESMQFELLSGEGVMFCDVTKVVGRCVWLGA